MSDFYWQDFGSLDDSEPISVDLTERKIAFLLAAMNYLERASWDTSSPEIFPIEIKDFNELSSWAWDWFLFNTGTIIESPSIDSMNGNLAPSQKLAYIQSGARRGRNGSIWLYFAEPHTITDVSFDFKYTDISSSGIITVRGIYLYDKDGNLITQLQSTSNAITQNVWNSWALAGSWDNVGIVRCQFSRTATNSVNPSDTEAWIDNVYINGSELDYDPIEANLADTIEAISVV